MILKEQDSQGPRQPPLHKHEKPPDTGEAADVEGLDPEELMESAKSVKPKQVSMVEELHGEFLYYFLGTPI